MRLKQYGWILVFLFLVGCNQSGETEKNQTQQKQEAEIKLEIATWEGIQKKIADHKGKVVVLDVWATSCTPCIKELPGLSKLQQKHQDQVACMTVSLDYDDVYIKQPQDAREIVMEKLKETISDPRIENFISADVDTDFYTKSKIDSIPTILIYNQSGQLHKQVDINAVGGKREITYELDVIPVVEQLLANE